MVISMFNIFNYNPLIKWLSPLPIIWQMFIILIVLFLFLLLVYYISVLFRKLGIK